MRTRILSENPDTGLTTFFHDDDAEGTITIENRVDVQDIIEANKDVANLKSDGWKGEMHQVASIPLVVYNDLKKKGIVDDERAFKRWLNDPDNRFFRTKAGVL